MFVVTRAVIPWIKRDGFAQYRRQCVSPFAPTEISSLAELHSQCENLGLPRLGENRPTLSRGTPGSASITSYGSR